MEVVQLLDSGDLPNGEILVERVKELRWAEKNGTYAQVFDAMSRFGS